MEQSLVATECKNCGAALAGAFCHECGQKTSVGRLNVRYFIDEVLSSLFQVEKGLFFTAKALSIQPGTSIRDYLQGQRAPHFKPLAYLLVTSAIYVFLAYLFEFNTYSKDFLSGFSVGVEEHKTPLEQKAIAGFNWLANNQVYSLLLTIPLFSIGSYLAFFRSGYNYLEHLIINVYITAHQLLIYASLSGLIPEDSIVEVLPLLLGVTYNLWAYCQFFRRGNGFKRVIQGLCVYLIFLFIFAVLMLIVIAIVSPAKV